MANKTILDLLLYYKGEKKNPFKASEIKYLYWELEYTYINMVMGSVLEDEYFMNFAFDFPDLLDEISKDIPVTLKGFMYDQFCHTGGSKKGFPTWFTDYANK